MMDKEGAITISSDAAGNLVCELNQRHYQVSPLQTRVLYALAESDHGWLSAAALCEVLFQLHRRAQPPTGTLPEPDQLQQLADLLPALVNQGLVTVTAPTPGGLVLGQIAWSGDAMALITYLTRSWPEWEVYGRQYNLFHY